MSAITVTNAEPSLDTAPVFKTTRYPWAEPADSFRPLAYARSEFLSGRGMLVDLQAFERSPRRGAADLLDDSCVALAFNFFPERSSDVICVIANADARCAVYKNGEPLNAELSLAPYAGEDEQGWYWGVRFIIPCSLLESVYGIGEVSPGQTMKGNFYKFLRAGEGAHLAAVCETDGQRLLLESGDLGEFTAVAY